VYIYNKEKNMRELHVDGNVCLKSNLKNYEEKADAGRFLSQYRH
jgi:hypothetical protein